MYNIGDYVVYRTDVCKIMEIIPTKEGDFYELSPMEDSSLIIKVPVADNFNLLRKVISKDEVLEIIQTIPDVMPLKGLDSKTVEFEYKKLLKGSYQDIIKVIKTTYMRNEERIKNNKKTTEKDAHYFSKAEKILYNEFSIALGLTPKETKEYIVNKINSKQ